MLCVFACALYRCGSKLLWVYVCRVWGFCVLVCVISNYVMAICQYYLDKHHFPHALCAHVCTLDVQHAHMPTTTHAQVSASSRSTVKLVAAAGYHLHICLTPATHWKCLVSGWGCRNQL